MHSRALLSLMVEMDNGRCMDSALRKTIEAEISAYAQVLSFIICHVLNAHIIVRPFCPLMTTPNLSRLVYRILLLPNDTRPEAASILANPLYRYRTSPTGRGLFGTTHSLASGSASHMFHPELVPLLCYVLVTSISSAHRRSPKL